MKKVILLLIASIACCGSFFAQQQSHWPDFNLYDYEQHGSLVACVKIDSNFVLGTDNYEDFEIGAFVNGTVRGHAFMDYFGNYGDLYPIVQLEIYYDATATDTGKEVAFKLYDHSTGHEYDICTSLNPDTGSAYVTGEDCTKYPTSEDAGFLVLSFFTPTITKTIEGYTEGSEEPDHYYLIATPIGAVNPGDVANMTSNQYDLYSFDQNAADGLQWINLRGSSDDLVTGMGYLYANSETVVLTFIGFAYEGSGEVTLSKNVENNPGCEFEGWNLVGNPFTQTAYITKPFYMMNEDGTEIISGSGNSVEPMEGIFVIADEDGEIMTFSTEEPDKRAALVMNITQNRGRAIDRAIIRFGQESTLPKFMLNENNTKVYIPQDDKEYAVVTADKCGEIPVNFEAAQNGTYTFNINAEKVDVKYLHLFDNMTGTDVDLLVNPSYTFNANANDYASRFKLVFATGKATDGNFAFYSNGNFIINNEGEATLQVVDVKGRILKSETIKGSASVSVNAASGIYMLRLINGNDVKVQKIMVE